MGRFASIYRGLFDRLGYPLKRSHALSGELLAKTEQRLGARIPTALREYSLVAGNEKRFNTAHNRFLHPSKWFIQGRHIAFMVENQSVCWWGVSVRNRGAEDPSIAQGLNDDEIDWRREHRKCSTFLAVMLHYQAVSGGFRFCGFAEPPENLHEMLKKDWHYAGEVNQLWAFSRENQAVCVMSGASSPIMPTMSLLAGGKRGNDLRSIEQSLSLRMQ